MKPIISLIVNFIKWSSLAAKVEQDAYKIRSKSAKA